MTPGTNIPDAQLPRLAPLDLPDDSDTDYRLVVVDVPFRNPNPTIYNRVTAPYQYAGDHLTVIQLQGPFHLGIAVNKGKAFIPVREGDVITRRFTEFRAKAFAPFALPSAGPSLSSGNFLGRMIVGVSWGPLLRQGVFKPGFSAGCPKFRGTATTTGVTLYGGADAQVDGGTARTICHWGGTVMIRNRDTAQSLFLYDGIGGDFNPAGVGGQSDPLGSWEILPGEVLSLDANSKLSSRRTIGTSTVPTGLCLACAAGTVSYVAMVSSWGDTSNMDDNQLSAAGQGSQTDLEYGSV